MAGTDLVTLREARVYHKRNPEQLAAEQQFCYARRLEGYSQRQIQRLAEEHFGYAFTFSLVQNRIKAEHDYQTEHDLETKESLRRLAVGALQQNNLLRRSLIGEAKRKGQLKAAADMIAASDASVRLQLEIVGAMPDPKVEAALIAAAAVEAEGDDAALDALEANSEAAWEAATLSRELGTAAAAQVVSA